MNCSISGEPTLNPVLSPVSNAVFDRALLETFIAQNGTDPITGVPLTVEELISIKTPAHGLVRPRTAAVASIPSMLAMFQSEWDAITLETFQLRQELLKARQELSTALYQHDAAVRVVARLMKERDEARQSLAQLSASI
ncbi:Prp19-domain-containing protein, partial [Nadsonia fulvescens var. elongata DSM 6958]